MQGVQTGAYMVVFPYNFLMHHMMQTMTRNSFSERYGLKVVCLPNASPVGNVEPDWLRGVGSSPHLIFTTVDAFANLMTNHLTYMHKLSKQGRLKRVFFDEIHTIYMEEHFRSEAFKSLRLSGRLSCPFTAMSATVPPSYAPSLMKYLTMGWEADKCQLEMVVEHCFLGDFPEDFLFEVKECLSPVTEALAFVEPLLDKESLRESSVHVICGTKADAGTVRDRLQSRRGESTLSCELITSETEAGNQERIASLWSGGHLNVLVTTTCGLLGNENRKCKSVIVVGYLYSLMNVVQALGRLRPGAQRINARFVMFLNNPVPHVLHTAGGSWAQQRERIKSAQVSGSGVLAHVPKAYLSIGTNYGIQKWARGESGCMLNSLCLKFGYDENWPVGCRVCTRCRSDSVRRRMDHVEERAQQHKVQEQKALEIISRLQGSCLFCHRDACTGEECHNGLCFKCGTRGCGSSQCSFDKKVFLSGKACMGCFDHYNREGYSYHSVKDCPLKRRLRRLIFSKVNSNKPINELLTDIYSSTESFYNFVSTFHMG